MNRLERLFFTSDFSKETNFKDILRTRLFGEAVNVHPSTLQRLSFEDMELVNAAGDVVADPGMHDES